MKFICIYYCFVSITRATGDNETAVIVTAEMFGAIIIELKETEQITSYLIAHAQKWTDSRLKWDPKQYNGIESIVVPISKIWRPDTYIYNSIELKDLVDEQKDFVRLYSTGAIELNLPQYVQAFCTIKVHMFPFDTQFCTIAFTTNQLVLSELNVSFIPPKFAKFRFMGNSEWELCNVSMVYHELTDSGIWGVPSLEIQYIFQIKRRSTFYITVIIIPIFLISSLSIIGIFAPGSENDTGNCVNLGLGTLLALIVLLGIVAERLPKSDDMPLLGYYILTILISFVFCVVLECSLLYYSHVQIKSGKRPPTWLYKITRTPIKDEDKLKKILERMQQKQESNINGTTIHKSNEILPVPDQNIKNGDANFTLKSVRDLARNLLKSNSKAYALRELIEEQKKIMNKSNKGQLEQENEDEWDRIENKLDFFWIFFFEALNIANLVFLMINVSASPPTIDDWLYGKNPVELFSY